MGSILQLAYDFLHKPILGSEYHGKLGGTKNGALTQAAATKRVSKSAFPIKLANEGFKRVDALCDYVLFHGLKLVADTLIPLFVGLIYNLAVILRQKTSWR